MSVTKRTRYEVLRRDDHTCRYCGGQPPDVKLTVDHVIPVALGGSDKPSNLVAACADCNAGKSSTNPDDPLVAVVTEDAVQWGRAMQKATEEFLADRDKAAELRRPFTKAWDRWMVGDKHIPVPSDWAVTIDTLMARGLPPEIIPECVSVAMENRTVTTENKFRYFCGIAWRKLDQLSEQAKEIFDQERTPGARRSVECDPFPHMEMFSVFLDEVFAALRLPRQARKIVETALWYSISKADDTYRSGHSEGCDPEDCKAFQLARDELTSVMAWDMDHLQNLAPE